MVKLSISIFAYRQKEQIKSQLDELVTYNGDDIEVVVSDDTPDDSIQNLVKSYSDSRFRYVRNDLGSGADGNYLNAIMSAESQYVWIFRSSDCALSNKISEVIGLVDKNPDCALYFTSSAVGDGLQTRTYKDSICKEVWHSGTLHPSGYVINKEYCDFDLYTRYIKKYFDDYKASNVAFSLLQADLGLKGNTLFSEMIAWKYAKTIAREDKAVNAPGGKNPFGLEFEYKRYALMLDYASGLIDEESKHEFTKKVIHTYAKQILHIFGKRNSSKAFLNHYGCERVEFNSYQERKKFQDETKRLLGELGIDDMLYDFTIKKEAFIYGVVKPTVYKIRNRK